MKFTISDTTPGNVAFCGYNVNKPCIWG